MAKENIKATGEAGYVFFHNPEEMNGYLSNWYICDFVFKGHEFSSSEQYMMWAKAELFGDKQIAKQIMQTEDCGKIKALGRKVRGFDGKKWDAEKERIVYEGLLEKFRQNRKLRENLKNTGNKILAECAVKDTIWGIGVGMRDPKRFNKSCWDGQNLLGKILMDVRDALRAEDTKE